MNEWEFTAEVASWINEIIAQNPALPFYRAKCEQHKKGSQKRRDITLLDKNQRIVLTGEVKLPYQKDGGSPYNTMVVNDARRKAVQAGTSFFFTWNVNEFVLWETVQTKTSWLEQNFKSWEVTSIHHEDHLDLPMTVQAIKAWLTEFLKEYSLILRGTAKIGDKSPDEKFIEMLESYLRMPILLNIVEMNSRYKNSKFNSEINRWMREEQGWVIYTDPDGIRDNLDRATKFSCYTLVNKLVFYESLLKRYGGKLDKICVPDHIDNGDALRLHLEGYFAEAKRVTRDYETVFGEEHISIGNRIPFYSDSSTPHWRELINQIHAFDFSRLDYEIIGNIFERLIAPEERHKYGQFYTKPEVVDLINSFCIRRGNEKIMDPACGGGTFLVRAYARKRELSPERKHHELLSDLYGVDISHFAAHLTTINLATRNLIDDENYPQVARSDFFDVMAHKTFIKLPKHMETKGLGKAQHRKVEIVPLDAVVGNPPYVRHQDIPKDTKTKGGFKTETKEYLLKLVKDEANIHLSGRSDIHCYFWPHAFTFLKDGGYLCFLTSSQWLDVEYGFGLQEWILSHFEIIAILESIDEPWFVGARVVTAITILKRQPDKNIRMSNTVRFVQLRYPIREILSYDGTTAGAIMAADIFRDELLSATENVANDQYRIRLVCQEDLWDEGVRLGQISSKSDETADDDLQSQVGNYYGGKWGVYLRAPDLWFRILDSCGHGFVPLEEIAEISSGILSGKDAFFLVVDRSDDILNKIKERVEFKKIYGIPRDKIESGQVKLVLCGEGRNQIRPIESNYLEPEIHSLDEVGKFTVSSDDCLRHILLVDKSKEEIKGTYVLDYINWGEKQGYHRATACVSRTSDARSWYDLTGRKRGTLLWPKAQQYKHVIAFNESNLQNNYNLHGVHAKSGISPELLAGILNSTLVVLSKYQFGRPVGVEGNLKTEIIDIRMMLVPDPRIASRETKSRIIRAFRKMKERKPLQFLSEQHMREMAYRQAGKEQELETLSDKSELDMSDRRELDDAVLELIGISSANSREDFINELYSYLREYFELTRSKEEKAILNKKRAKRRIANPKEIAMQIYQAIVEKHADILRHYDSDFLNKAKAFDTYDLPAEGTPSPHTDLFSDTGVLFVKGKKSKVAIIKTKNASQDELIILVANSGQRGFVRIPRDEDECCRLNKEYSKFLRNRERAIQELIEERTSDEEMKEEIHDALMPFILHGHSHSAIT
jgi:hypothetical protein